MELYDVRLLVRNFPACYYFYRDVVGLAVETGQPTDLYASFRAGSQGRKLSLYQNDLMAVAVRTGHLPHDTNCRDKALLSFRVDSVDEAADRLRGKGLTLVTEPANHPEWGTRTVHFRDPDGNLLEFCQPLAR